MESSETKRQPTPMVFWKSIAQWDLCQLRLARQDKSFCLSFVDSCLCLKRTHAYYSQVQMQMAIVDCAWADFFFLYTRTENGPSFFLERISFDKDFWARAKATAKFFHQKFVVLELLTKRVQRNVQLVPCQT